MNGQVHQPGAGRIAARAQLRLSPGHVRFRAAGGAGVRLPHYHQQVNVASAE